MGRRAYSEQLAGAVAARPVVQLWGIGGIGKSALVLHTLHQRCATQVECTVVVAARPGDTTTALGVGVVRALAAAEAITGLDWTLLQSDYDALAATMIDLAELGGWQVVLEDVHHVSGMDALVEVLTRYARASRWLIVGRVQPASAEALTIGPMSPAELAELAAAVAPQQSASECTAQAVRAAGSPWRLQQCLAGADPQWAPGQPDPLAGLEPAQMALVRALAAVEIAIPELVLAAIEPLPGKLAMQQLARRGLIERAGGGWRLHEVARAQVSPLSPLHVVPALVRHGGAAAVIEAVRLLISVGDVVGAVRVLDDLPEIGGWAPQLWAVIGGCPESVLTTWRLRCAVALGDRDAFANLPEPEPGDQEARLLWARGLLMCGRLDEAEQVAGALAGFHAGLVVGRCQRTAGRHAEAMATLRSLVPATPDGRAERDMELAACHTLLGHFDEALALAEALQTQLTVVTPALAVEVGYAIAWVHYGSGRVRRAAEALEAMRAHCGPAAQCAGFTARRQFLEMVLAVDLGRLGEARALCDRIRAPQYQLYTTSTDSVLRLVTGELEGLDAQLAEAAAVARDHGLEHVWSSIVARRYQLATLTASSAPDCGQADGDNRGTFDALLALRSSQHRVRAGGQLDRSQWPALPTAELQSLAAVVEAEAAAVAGDPEAALERAGVAVELAGAQRLAWCEAEARLLVADLLVVVCRPGELVVHGRWLESLAERAPSAALAAAASWVALVAADHPQPEKLEQLAELQLVAPVAARRAQALLGHDVSLDQLDIRVLAAIDWRIEPGDGWGIDERRRAVWVGGRLVALDKHPLLWRLLLEISAGNGSKEQLVCAVWQEAEYHPLRHDNRLHTAVRKLRKRIELDPREPQWIVTTPEGYSVGRRPARVNVDQ